MNKQQIKTIRDLVHLMDARRVLERRSPGRCESALREINREIDELGAASIAILAPLVAEEVI